MKGDKRCHCELGIPISEIAERLVISVGGIKLAVEKGEIIACDNDNRFIESIPLNFKGVRGKLLSSTELARKVFYLPKRPDGDFFMHGIPLLSGVDDPEVIQAKVLHCHPHRSCDLWRFGEFDLHGIATSAMEEEEINFRSIMGCPEKALKRLDNPQDLFKSEALPGSTNTRVTQKAMDIR